MRHTSRKSNSFSRTAEYGPECNRPPECVSTGCKTMGRMCESAGRVVNPEGRAENKSSGSGPAAARDGLGRPCVTGQRQGESSFTKNVALGSE
jgi:hypothetical protein